jgi:c(7)-type cytochrome triheme protein
MKQRYAFFPFVLVVLACSVVYAIDIKDVSIKTANFGKVIFSHADHFRREGIKNNCKTCHNAIYNLRKQARFTMADMEKGKSCGACHNGKRAFDLKECIRCHKASEVTIKVKETGPLTFSHKKHVKADNCALCHPAIYDLVAAKPVTMAQMEKGKSCGACHNGKDAFKTDDCTKCHPAKDVVFKIQETGDLTFSHEFHTGLLKCGDCHVKLYLPSPKNKRVTMAEMEKGKSCGACHNGKDAFKADECMKCHPVKDVEFKVPDTGDAKFSHEFHTGLYKCGDCHVKLYLPSTKNKKITMAEMEAAKSCGACHNEGKDAFSVKGDCDRCHKM